MVHLHYSEYIFHPAELAGDVMREIKLKVEPNPPLLGSYDHNSNPKTQKSTVEAKQWLSRIDTTLIEKIYKLYEPDFALLDYTNFSDPNFPFPQQTKLLALF